MKKQGVYIQFGCFSDKLEYEVRNQPSKLEALTLHFGYDPD